MMYFFPVETRQYITKWIGLSGQSKQIYATAKIGEQGFGQGSILDQDIRNIANDKDTHTDYFGTSLKNGQEAYQYCHVLLGARLAFKLVKCRNQFYVEMLPRLWS